MHILGHIMMSRLHITKCTSNFKIQREASLKANHLLPISCNKILICPSRTGTKDLSSYESEKRPIALYELAGSLAIESKLLVLCPFPVSGDGGN